MRKNLKSLAPTLWFVIIAFIISIFAVWGGAGRLGESRGSNTIVTVGGEKISADVYVQNLRQRLENLQAEFKQLDANFIQQLNIPQQVLEYIIQQRVLLQTAKELGIRSSDEEIRQKIISYPVFQRDGKFIGFEEYRKVLTWNRISMAEFENSLVNEIIIEKLLQVFGAGIPVSQEELWDNYKKNNESAKMEYILVESAKMELASEPDAETLREYFNQHQDDYKISEAREADYVFINTDDLKKEFELTDSEIEDYYQDNLNQFTDPEQTKVSRIYLPFEEKEESLVRTEAQNVLDRINQGEDFGTLAQTFSKDEKAKDRGDWGLMEWRRLSQPEQETIGKLEQDEISELIELSEGISIIKITEKKPSVQKSLAEVKERISNILTDQKAREIADQRIAQLEKTAQKEKSLDVAAQKLGYRIKSTGLVKEGDPIEEIDPSGSISRSLFSLELKGLSSPIFTFKGTGLAELQRIEDSRPAAYEEVETEVMEAYELEKKEEIALEKATAFRADLQKTSMESLAEKQELEYKTSEEHKRGQYLGVIGENPEVDKLAFSLPLNELSKPIKYNNGYLLLRVQERKEVTPEDLEANRVEEKKNLLETKKNKFFQSYYLKLREARGVKPNYNLFLRINSELLARYER